MTKGSLHSQPKSLLYCIAIEQEASPLVKYQSILHSASSGVRNTENLLWKHATDFYRHIMSSDSIDNLGASYMIDYKSKDSSPNVY